MLCIENLKEYDYSLVKSKFAFWLALGKKGNEPYSGYYYHNNDLLFCFFEDYTLPIGSCRIVLQRFGEWLLPNCRRPATKRYVSPARDITKI